MRSTLPWHLGRLFRSDLALDAFADKMKRNADVAQLVEQLIRNQQVIGSSPIVGSTLSPKNSIIYKRPR